MSASGEGIGLLVDAFKWGGASYHGAGWCPRHIEGVEHYVFYALEAHTGRKFLHGQAVCLGIVAGALMHGRRVAELVEVIHGIGVEWRPEAMGITWRDVETAISGLADFVRANGMPHGIANDFRPDDAFFAELRRLAGDGP